MPDHEAQSHTLPRASTGAGVFLHRQPTPGSAQASAADARAWPPAHQEPRPQGRSVDTNARQASLSGRADSVDTNATPGQKAAQARSVDKNARQSSTGKVPGRAGVPRHGTVDVDQVPVPAPAQQPAAFPSPTPSRFSELRRRTAQRLEAANTARRANVAFMGEGSGRTANTVKSYEKRSRQLLARCAKDQELEEGMVPDPVVFANWFRSRRADLSHSAYRTYKQAVRHYLTSVEGERSLEAINIIDSDEKWDPELDGGPRNSGTKPASKPSGRTKVTSAQKAKAISYEDYQRLDAYLHVRCRTETSMRARHWLRAGFATGLRPEEWRATEVVHWRDPTVKGGKRTYLFVVNSKSTHGRGNDTLRTLEITNFTAETMTSVQYMSDNGFEWELAGGFGRVQTVVSQLLYRSDDILWPRRKTTTVSLYTCRHQFTLNMKETGIDGERLSAMLGHVVTDTQLSHYGKRKRSWPVQYILDKPSPVEQEVATVRKTLDMAMQRERLETIIGLRNRRSGADDASADMSAEDVDLAPDGYDADDSLDPSLNKD